MVRPGHSQPAIGDVSRAGARRRKESVKEPSVTVSHFVEVREPFDLHTEFRRGEEGGDGEWVLRCRVGELESDDQDVLRPLAEAWERDLASYRERLEAKRAELAGDPEAAAKLKKFLTGELAVAAGVHEWNYRLLADAVVIPAAMAHAAQELSKRVAADLRGLTAQEGPDAGKEADAA
jgi:hypothetical protein